MLLRALALFSSLAVSAAAQDFAFTLSIPQPATHTLHVTLRCSGLTGEFNDFKMPVWMPGYYRVLDYAKNLTNFHAADSAGRELKWQQVSKNAWRVVTAGAPSVKLDYDVTGTIRFAAQTYIAEDRAYLAPPATFLHIAGKLNRPATVTIERPASWKTLATGLDPVAGRANTYRAADFDVLYDTPILMGNQEEQHFDLKGVRHDVAIENIPESVSREQMVTDLKRMVEAATKLIGDVPYSHYMFLMMGQGNGGIEHLNSASILFNGTSLSTPEGYRRWLSYVAHEYFHNFNVKRIRPIALGPFDYDRENLTNMLWVSEGLSVYYQDLLCLRAGLITREQYLDKLRDTIQRFENASGHRYQSATESSWNTWGTSGVGGDRNISISYYDNGAMLGAILDLAIRHATGNAKSLDDVMRTVYRTYYQQKKRGFTDAEFREACETAAGTSLAEVFEYASTTKEMDYAKYLAWAGLEVAATASDGKGLWLGANVQARDNGLLVTDVVAASPADGAGLRPGDLIIAVDGTAKPTVKMLSDAITAKKPGDVVTVKVTSPITVRPAESERRVQLATAPQWAYSIQPARNPVAAQKLIAESWLGK
jgi:predicted metalloprotease with PDZ domain